MRTPPALAGTAPSPTQQVVLMLARALRVQLDLGQAKLPGPVLRPLLARVSVPALRLDGMEPMVNLLCQKGET
jgi:hypothetical protein